MFCNTKELGELTVKEVFLFDNNPLLFACKSSLNVLFLVWRVGNRRWLAIPIKQPLIEKVKTLQVSVRGLYTNPPGGYIYEIIQKSSTYTSTPHFVTGE